MVSLFYVGVIFIVERSVLTMGRDKKCVGRDVELRFVEETWREVEALVLAVYLVVMIYMMATH